MFIYQQRIGPDSIDFIYSLTDKNVAMKSLILLKRIVCIYL